MLLNTKLSLEFFVLFCNSYTTDVSVAFYVFKLTSLVTKLVTGTFHLNTI